MNLTITEHVDILDTRDSMRKPMYAALALHTAIVAAVVVSNYLNRSNPFGSKDVAGGAVAVQAVNTIPIQHHGATNPVANDTQSQTPQAPPKPVDAVKQPKPKPDAVALKKEPKKKFAPQASEKQKFRSYKSLEDNQVTAKQAPQVSSPIYSAPQGSGSVGVGAHSIFGDRFAAYGSQIQQIVASNWHTSDVDQKYQTAPQVVATFELMRDGSIRNPQIAQTSGVPSLDFTVRRAILDSRFPPFPQGLDKNSVTVEFWFELKR